MIYSSDHRPAHVHVIGGGGRGSIQPELPQGPPILREVYGLSRADVARIRAVIAAELSVLCVAWESIRGET
jgi:hypothetical protein